MRGKLVIVACLGALSVFGCDDGDDDDVGLPPETPPGEQPPPGDPPPPTQVMRIDMNATEYRFEPAQLVVEPGQPLQIVLNNVGTDLHSIAFDLPDRELRLEMELLPGQTGELRFTAPMELGAYDYWCPVSNHRQLGMVGSLIVERRQ